MVKMGLVLGLVAMVAGCVHDRGPQTDSGATLTEDAATSPIVDAGAADAGPRRCNLNVDCDDGIECTIDECLAGNTCRHDGLDSRCPLGSVCTPGIGCEERYIPCESHGDCDDGDLCNGHEVCIALGGGGTLTYKVCQPGPVPEILAPGCACESNSQCDDGYACNGTEDCHEGACRFTPAPEPPPEGC